jgi:hypothetical protein
MTAVAGNVSLEVDDTSRWGAETGGAITSTVCASGTRELARSRDVSRGAGAMTVEASASALRILSRATFGAGGMTDVLNVGEGRVLAWETSGAGGTTLVARAFGVCLADEFSSGAGGTAFIVCRNAGRVGAMRAERNPSAGGGPGFALKASRLATAESE